MKYKWHDWNSMKTMGITNLNSISRKISKDNFGSYWVWDEVDLQALGPFDSIVTATKEGNDYYSSLNK